MVMDLYELSQPEVMEFEASLAKQALEKGPCGFVAPPWYELKRDHIWLRNDTGEDVRVYVHRFRKIKEVLEQAYKANADAKGSLGVEAAWKNALEAGDVQIIPVPATHTRKMLVFLGPKSGGARVTACKESRHSAIFGKDVIVKEGYCCIITPDTTEDQVLTQPPDLAAPAAADA